MSATTFFYPVVKEPTGRLQFATNRAAAINIDRIGEVHRGQVITIGPPNKPPTPKALDFARGLVASGNFSHVAADTPLGVPAEVAKTPMSEGAVERMKDERRQTEKAELIEDLEALRAAGAFGGATVAAPTETLSSTVPTVAIGDDIDAANREHLATFDGTPESVKKSPK